MSAFLKFSRAFGEGETVAACSSLATPMQRANEKAYRAVRKP